MQLGFYFDQTRCTGCYACMTACKDWHDIPAGPVKWMRVLYNEEGKFPELFVSHIATPCYHCENPICSFVCPNEAITKREDGIVVVDRDKCRGEYTCGIIDEQLMGPGFVYGEAEAPCQLSCPAHVNVPAYCALIAKGYFREALELIRSRMPLPLVCGRVCLHPCETECRRKEVDEPIAIMSLKRFASGYVSQELPERLPQTQEDKVAIVGSGPAGLAAGYDLIRMGYGVTIFEALPVVGGMLSAGIPEHRLPREILKRDIDYLEALGMEIKTNTPIGQEQGIDELFNQGYGAVLLSIGAHTGQKLNIPGAELDGSMVGTSFMRDVNFGHPVKLGQRVLVMGGGNVAMDCARSATRLGAADVHVACLESREEMPAEASELAQAEEEGIKVHPSLTLTRIIGNEGKISGAEFVGVTGLYFDENGQPHFDMVKGSEQTLPVDTVIFAIGQTPDLTGLERGRGVQINQRGTLATDPETMMLNRGVFATGDCVTGVTSVVDAIASGQKAAFYINRYLQGDVVKVRPEKAVQASEIKVNISADIEKKARQTMPLVDVADRVSNFKEVAQGFSPEAAMEEGKRCLNCAGHLCKDVCPYNVPQFADEEKAKMQKCDLCLERWPENKEPICVESCPPRALDAGAIDELKAKYRDVTEARGFVYSPTAQPSIVFKPKRPRESQSSQIR